MRLVAILTLFMLASIAYAAGPARYPHEVKEFQFESQRQSLKMAYMDATPQGELRGTFVLLHGKNFNGAYWHQTIDFLSKEGFRVVVPDQIGFGQSTLPQNYQFTFDQLAANTHKLLEHLGIQSAQVLGHSMGGMLATQFSLQYPDFVNKLILLNPIGLEDWRGLGVPYVPVEKIYESEKKKDYDSIRDYQQASYYDGNWKKTFKPWAQMLADQYDGENGDLFAWNMALTSDMVLSQPVIYEFDQLKMRTILMIGLRDRTAIGRGLVDEKLAQQMGDYPELGKKAAERIPDSRLIEFDNVGHLPHIEAPDRYLEALGRVIN